MTSYQCRKSHCWDKMILQLSYLHNGISYTGTIVSLYWIQWDNAHCCQNWLEVPIILINCMVLYARYENLNIDNTLLSYWSHVLSHQNEGDNRLFHCPDCFAAPWHCATDGVPGLCVVCPSCQGHHGLLGSSPHSASHLHAAAGSHTGTGSVWVHGNNDFFNHWHADFFLKIYSYFLSSWLEIVSVVVP